MTSKARAAAALSIVLIGAVNAAAQTCAGAPGTIVNRVYVVLSQTEELESDQLIAAFADQPPVAMTHEPSLRRWHVDLLAPLRVTVGTLALDRSTGRQLSVGKVGWMIRQSSEPTVTTETIAGVSRCTAMIGFSAIRAWRVQVKAVNQSKEVSVDVICDRKACGPSSKTKFTSEWMTASDPFGMKAKFLFECYFPAGLVRDAPGTIVDRWQILRQLTPRDCLAPVRLSALAQIVPDSISLSPLVR